MLPRLDKLLHNCTVKILTDSGTCCGTGFFIAPRVVMTCGHAIKNKQEKDLVKIITYEDDQEVNAQVKVLFPGGADIALLSVQPGFFSSSCVYLDTEIAPLDKCYAFGFTDSDGFPKGDPVGLECEGITGGVEPFIKLKMGQVRPGLSGSPLLNFRTGKVCGVIKFTRSRSTDLGGG
jgi:Trypsin-like peptidase domain